MIDTDQQHAEQDTEVGAAVARIMAAVPTFHLGDRVRVLPRECSWCRETGDQEVGLTGVVEDVGHDCDRWNCREEAEGDSFDAHPYWVTYDGGIEIGGVDAGWFAPSELELLS